jgi:hypothetical protein
LCAFWCKELAFVTRERVIELRILRVEKSDVLFIQGQRRESIGSFVSSSYCQSPRADQYVNKNVKG